MAEQLRRLKTEATIRKAARTAFTRPVDIPGAIIEDVPMLEDPQTIGKLLLDFAAAAGDPS